MKKIIICTVILLAGLMSGLMSGFVRAEEHIGDLISEERAGDFINVGQAVHVTGNYGLYYLNVESACEYSICAYNANQCDTFLMRSEERCRERV